MSAAPSFPSPWEADAVAVVVEGGEHVTIFTHRDRVVPDVARFLAATSLRT